MTTHTTDSDCTVDPKTGCHMVSMPLEVLHKVSDVSDSLKASLEAILVARDELDAMQIWSMLRPTVELLHDLTEEHFPA